MYNSKKAIKLSSLSLNDILTKVEPYDIYRHYLGDFKVGALYNSPFRKDKNPSFGVFVSRSGDLLYKDHGTGECGNVIKFVGSLTGLIDNQDILDRITHDLKITNSTPKLSSTRYVYPTNKIIGIIRQPFTKEDLDYWKQYSIKKSTLNKYCVYSISHYLLNGLVKLTYKNNNPLFAYKVYNNFKIYRPLSSDKKYKWRSSLTEFDIQGYEQLPEQGNLLVITKSLKDVMCLHEMNIAAISPSSETTFIPDIVLETLLKRFKHIILLYDRDITGMKQSRSISLKTGLYAMFINKKYQSKDISDAIKLWGKKTIQKWLYTTLQNKNYL